MKRFTRGFVIAALLGASASTASAVSDHLQCLKIKDAVTAAQYSADITPTDGTFAPATGCTIKVPAKLLCVDATKSNVMPMPPGANPGQPAQKYLCYKAKCPADKPTTTLTDQFGTHSITVKGTSLVCAPVPVPVSCTDGMQNGTETGIDCGGGSCPTCANGQGCGSDSDCTSGNCSAGVCSPAMPSCTDGMQNGTETGVDCGGGHCPTCANGQGCSSGSDCTSGTCSGGLCANSTCSDGMQNGNETGVDCGGGTCPTCGAGQGCLSGMDCTSGTCTMGLCQSLLMNGQACSSSGQCSSNSCVDGVCCNTACIGLCQACTAAKKGSGADGSCGVILNGFDPDNECSAAAQSTCGNSGTCNGAGACGLYPAMTICAAGSCSMGTQTAASTCDGGGTCVGGTMSSCAPYACGLTACRTNCGTDTDCASGNYCSAGACVPQHNAGDACATSSQCLSGNCVDGVCCNTSCAGLCQACTLAKNGSADGACLNIPSGFDPDNECAGSQTCDGAGACQP